ncbi:hypothetical protein PZ897_06890 [Hoeflea sp. YIM 152468]|uniref:hypothetical protein n=1 Tax=Hoeflea sp. YIM 152468 TaxID=3031759 RepID=UPI0023DA3D39|nr:hypothetical protein [Hoeflea sp. YIM 152468]MDF1607895.1 hypothetical protein [Hoeflea sp. YIM 152468]
MKPHRIIAIGALAALLAACQSATYSPRPMPVQPQGIEGQWVGADGIAISTFSNGTFSSVFSQTGELLTRGNYIMTDAQTVDISFFSMKSERNKKARCLIASTNQMNCTDDGNTQFTLVRRI